MYCFKCGARLEEHTKFCHRCGARTEPITQSPFDDRTIGFADAFPGQTPPSITANAANPTPLVVTETPVPSAPSAPTPKPLDLTDDAAVERWIAELATASARQNAGNPHATRELENILGSYREPCDLSACLLASNPVKLAEAMYALNNEALLDLLSLLDRHLSGKENGVPLLACKNGITAILKERVKRGELYA